MNYFKNLEDELYIVGWFAVIFAIAGAALYLYVIPLLGIDNVCTFYAVTGLYCPGCGGTRAMYSLLHGKIIKSLYFHPIVLYSLVMYGGFMVSHTLEKLRVPRIKGWKFHTWYIYVGLFLLISNWILKNVLLVLYHFKMPSIY